MSRVIAYIDGMNLYHGLRDRFGRRHHWLDVEALARSVLLPRQRLERTYFYTARVRNQPESEQRQDAYLSVLAGRSALVHIVEGRFQERFGRCRSCGTVRVIYEEKETDVNIAAGLIRDAAADRYDTALLVSADSDLAPAITTARDISPGKRFLVAFPPRRRSDLLRRTSDAALTLGEAKIRAAQLPDKIVLPSGATVERPPYWR